MSLQRKPANKLLHKYQRTLHESATRSAFQNLLAERARRRKWRLIPEHPGKLAPGAMGNTAELVCLLTVLSGYRVE